MGIKRSIYEVLKVFSGKFKLEVLDWMWSNRASLPETALHFDISAPSTIWSWEKKYNEKGVEALFNRSCKHYYLFRDGEEKNERG
ncbi:helix-turn-helix domain-containing protein [Neobacillus cucumis]|uniref:helix-turn-helix domain-containing protein n=1 Tax=Neobacillus cucumis TaxID=1740721 RepID=UPI0035A9968F